MGQAVYEPRGSPHERSITITRGSNKKFRIIFLLSDFREESTFPEGSDVPIYFVIKTAATNIVAYMY